MMLEIKSNRNKDTLDDKRKKINSLRLGRKGF